jgi:diguanylate cyclase (GGDEF)-like protein/PAS domain S-box-containing protein
MSAGKYRAHLAAIVEASEDGIVGRTLDGAILSWNAGMERMFGYTAAEALGRDISFIAPPDRRHEAQHHAWLLRQTQTVPPYETVRIAKDGRPVHVHVSMSAVRDGAGNLTRMAEIYRDVTERRRAEEALRESRRRLATLIENLPGFVYRCRNDADWTFEFASNGCLDITGYRPDELIDNRMASFGKIVHPDDAQPLLGKCQASLAARKPCSNEYRITHRSGEIRWVWDQARGIYSETGQLLFIEGFVADVTARRRMELDADRRARLTELLEALARTANEASTPTHAMQRCVEQICEFGKWPLGCVGIFGAGASGVPQATHWHVTDSARFAEFMRISDHTDHRATRGLFVGKVLRERQPVWLADLPRLAAPGRMGHAARLGLRSAFAFPVIVGEEIAAFLEFFAEEAREPDALFLSAIGTVGAQLARLIERSRAAAVNAHLASIVECSQDAIVSSRPDGTILTWNAAAERMFGFAAADAVGRNSMMLVPEDQRAEVRQRRESCLSGHALEPYESERVANDGRRIAVSINMSAIRDETGNVTGVATIYRDITERKEAEARSDYLAHYDEVTGLPNRRLFHDRLTLAMARDKRRGLMTGLLLLDLDRFKQVNEAFGHSAGDSVLRLVGARLRDRLREVDTIARLSADEFAVILESITEKAQALIVAEKIVEAMAEPLIYEGEEIFVTISVGAAVYPADADTGEDLMKCAELAMYRAKEEGRNTAQIHDAPKGPQRSVGLEIESRLRRALERDELLLHFQPKIDVRRGTIIGAEALVRWRSPDLGMVSPAQFIPLAEETGLILPIGEWVLHAACMQAAAWRRNGHPLTVAVNLSARQFRQKGLIAIIDATLADTALPPECLELEITESMIMHSAEQAVATLKRLRELGLILAVDDFGTGYSSLAYLKRFPVHKLKVDQSFVRDLHKDVDDAAIVRAVIALATSLGLKTVAEGVETEQQLIYLAGLDCDEYQGYYFSKPLPACDFARLLREYAVSPDAHLPVDSPDEPRPVPASLRRR